MTKKISVLATLCLLLGCLAACGDSTGTSGGEGGEGSSDSNGSHAGESSAGSSGTSDYAGKSMQERIAIEGGFLRLTMTESYGIAERDDANRTLTLVQANKAERCVLAGGAATWRTVDEGTDTLVRAWRFGAMQESAKAFLRDKRNLSAEGGIYLSIYDPAGRATPIVLVGNDSSGIDGTWNFAQCVDVADTLVCDERLFKGLLLLNPGVDFSNVYAIGDGRISSSAKISVPVDSTAMASEPNVSLAFSQFMESTYGALARGRSIYDAELLSAGALFQEDSESVAWEIERNGIQILSQTAKTQTFVLNGREFQVVVNAAEAALNARGDGADYALDVAVTSGDVTCRFAGTESQGVDENSCSTELYDSYDTEYTYDADDNEIVYAYGIVDDNVEEYLDCLAAFAPDDVDDGYDWDFPAPAPADPAKAALREAPARLKKHDSFFHRK